MATSLVKIVSQLKKVDKITGFPENILLGYSDTSSASEHLARYLFCRNYVKGLILDVAAGSCYGSSVLASNESNYVVSVDMNFVALLYGKRVFTRKNTDAVCCHAEYLPFRSACFDGIVSIETLEHLRDPYTFLKEVKRIMKHSGLLILTTPNKNLTSPIIPPLNPHHFQEYNYKDVLALFKVAGLRIIATFYQTRISIPLLFMRVIGSLLAFILVKFKISILPIRTFLNKFKDRDPLEPDPSRYPICPYNRTLDTLTNSQLMVFGKIGA